MRHLFFVAALAVVMTSAPGALARVSVEAGALPAAQASPLDVRWKQAELGHIDVLFLESAAKDAVGRARREFEARPMTDDQAMMVVAVRDRQVGVHAGQAFTDAGVTGAVIDGIVAREFVPLARRGDYAGAAFALASALEAARKDPTPALKRRATALQELVQTRLKREALGHIRIDVEPTRSVTAELAASRFAELLLLPYEALVMKNVDDPRVWPVLGKGYRADQAAIQRAVDEVYAPLAKRGDVEGGLVALARRLASFYPDAVPGVTPWRAAVDRAPAIRERLKAEGLKDYAVAFEPGPVGTRKRRTYQAEDTTIVVYPKARAIVVELGAIYQENGPLPEDVLAYGRLAMQGDVEGEILAMARKLEQARRPIVAERRKRQAFIGLGVAGGCGALGWAVFHALSRQRRRSQRRLKAVQARHHALLTRLLQADEASRRGEAARRGMPEVDALALTLLEAAQDFDRGHTTARGHLASWRTSSADEEIEAMEERVPMLEMGAAAVLAAYEGTEGDPDPAAVVQRVKDANQAALDWQELRAASKALRPVMSKVGELDKLDKLLKDARADLTKVPVALEQARGRLSEACTIREKISEGFTLTKTVAAAPDATDGQSGLDGLAARRALAWEMARVRYDVEVPSARGQGSSADDTWGFGSSGSDSRRSGSSADDSWRSSDDRGSSGGGSW